jgi:hypothetical protein
LVLEEQLDQDTELELLWISNVSSAFNIRESLKIVGLSLGEVGWLAEELVDLSFELDDDLEAHSDLLGSVELVLQSVAHEVVVLELRL